MRQADTGSPDRLLAGGAAVASVVVMGLGIWLRLGLGGVVAMPATFGFLRHAHSHGGIYALLFPLLWMAWRALGAPSPGAREVVLYLAASALAFAGFATEGYALPSIVASSAVGGVWLASAWGARSLLRRPGWLRTGPAGIVLAAAMIPPIALFTRRDPAFAQRLVHTFLAILFFLVFVPAALARLGARPVPALAWSALAVVAALFVGVLPNRGTGVGLAGLGLCMAVVALRAGGDPLARAGFVALGVGSMAAGAFGSQLPHNAAMGGVHFLVLGPLLASLAPAPALVRLLGLLGAATMAAFLAGADLGLAPGVAQVGAAVAGAAVLPAALAGLRVHLV